MLEKLKSYYLLLLLIKFFIIWVFGFSSKNDNNMVQSAGNIYNIKKNKYVE